MSRKIYSSLIQILITFKIHSYINTILILRIVEVKIDNKREDKFNTIK